MSGDALSDDGVSPPAPPIAESSADALFQTPWLSQVPPAVLNRLADRAVLHRVPAGSMLFEQAETPTFAQFLIDGSVEMLGVRGRNETLVELIVPVDLLLPAAVLNRQPYLLRARVHEDAHLLMVEADTFRTAVAEDQALCLAILACQAAQFRRQVKHGKNVLLRSAEERVGCYLVGLLNGATMARLPLEKRMIASQLGMTRETFSRTLAAMVTHGIRVTGDVVIAEDPAAAHARFRLDPLIDGAETVEPLAVRRGTADVGS